MIRLTYELLGHLDPASILLKDCLLTGIFLIEMCIPALLLSYLLI